MASTPSSYVGATAASPITGGVISQQISVNTIQNSSAQGLTVAPMAGNPQVVGIGQPNIGLRPAVSQAQATSTASIPSSVAMDNKVLDKRRLQELVKEVDPLEQLDEDVEEVLMQIADDFIESVVTASCKIAKHRKSNVLETKDVQLHLERSWGMWVPGFGTDELRPYKRACTTEAHKQRMALIRKTLKKS